MLRKSLYLALPILISSAVNAQTVTPQDFNKLTADFTVGNVKVKPSDTIDFPTLIWGGDVALLRANGGERTLPTSTLGKLGVKIKTVSGDDFIAQTKRYLAGDTPFGRCEMGDVGYRVRIAQQ